MSQGISTLLTRNPRDVFGENDPARRRAAIDEVFTEDCVFYDPRRGVYRGRDQIDRVAGAIRATHPDFRYQPIAEPEESGNGGRNQWVSGRPGEAPAYAGTDFIIARDGRIAALYLFFRQGRLTCASGLISMASGRTAGVNRSRKRWVHDQFGCRLVLDFERRCGTANLLRALPNPSCIGPSAPLARRR